MLKYSMNPEVLPLDKRMTVSSIVRNGGLISSARRFNHFVEKGAVRVRGQENIKDKSEMIDIRDDMVIEVDGIGNIRVRLEIDRKGYGLF